MNLIKLNEQGDLCIKSTYATNRTFSFNIFKCYGETIPKKGFWCYNFSPSH